MSIGNPTALGMAYLYCTAYSSWLKAGPVLEQEFTVMWSKKKHKTELIKINPTRGFYSTKICDHVRSGAIMCDHILLKNL